MKGRDKGPKPPTCLSKHRDGWMWEPPMRLPSRRRRPGLLYDDRQGRLAA